MRRVVVVTTALACASVLVACTPDAPDSDLPAFTGASAVVTPTEAAAPSDEVEDMSDPELGIVFQDVPTGLTGDAADVHNWIATYDTEYWRTMRTNTVSPAFATIASSDVQEVMAGIAEQNRSIEATIGGTLRVTVSDIEVDGDAATGVLCDDYTDVTFATPGETFTPEEAGYGTPEREVVSLQRVAGDRWQIMGSEVSGTC